MDFYNLKRQHQVDKVQASPPQEHPKYVGLVLFGANGVGDPQI